MMRRHFDTSKQLCRYVAERSPDVLLSFSGGKESVASWCVLRKYFKRVVPFYLYQVPGVEFVERGLRYYEEFFGARILRLPHPTLYRMLNNLVFQPPENCLGIEEAGLRRRTHGDMERIARRLGGLSGDAFCAVGVRCTDSLMRRTALLKWGSLNPTSHKFWPVFDFRNDDLCELFRAEGIRLMDDYRLFGRSFDGLQYEFLGPLKEAYPRDYARILEWFPLAELEVVRQELRRKHASENEE